MKTFFGYIEGYYGRLLSWDDRLELLHALNRLSLNTYVYGPKEDPFHRLQWKLPYPKKWNDLFRHFVAEGIRKGVQVIPSLSPGLSYDYGSNSDYRILKKKFRRFADCGTESAALLMDDIPEILPRSSARSFSSLGSAHGELLQRLLLDLRRENPGFSLWFCPTVYCDQFAKDPVRKNRYLVDLASAMPSDVNLLWTGPSVIAKSITRKNIAAVSELFHGNIILWDNFYANDYCPNRLFAGPYSGRSPDVLSVTGGICLNPTGLVKTDTLLLKNLSDFVNDKVQSALSDDLLIPKEFDTVSRFLNSPFSKTSQPDFTSRKRALYQKALKYLLWDWKSPLQREWYPFLFMLDTDLKLLERLESSTAGVDWITKKYPPVLATVLSKSLPRHRRGRR